MAQINYPISRYEANKCLVSLPKSLYTPEALRQTTYKFSGEFYVIFEENEDTFEVFFENKKGDEISDKEIKEICNDFIDQQIRIDTENQFGHIRDLIVEEAFKPVNK